MAGEIVLLVAVTTIRTATTATEDPRTLGEAGDAPDRPVMVETAGMATAAEAPVPTDDPVEMMSWTYLEGMVRMFLMCRSSSKPTSTGTLSPG